MLLRFCSGQVCALFFVFYLVFFSVCIEAGPKIPEKFVYDVYWLGIRAGTATLEFKETPEGVTIKSSVVSAPFISVFYEVDDFAQSTLYVDGYPRDYILKVREGRSRRDKATHFMTKPADGPQKIIYNNKLDDHISEYYLMKQAFDPLSGFYEIRKRPLKVGHPAYLDIFDSKKVWNVEVQVLRKERVRIPDGEFDTIVIKPLMQSEGI
ncbi:MAG: DUF3108 domain-containing protein, partial [Candidatus Mariimomonas ferrooxydans]